MPERRDDTTETVAEGAPLEIAAPTHSTSLVPIRPPKAAAEPLDDPRRSDVDEWGRSERVREPARRLYGPVDRRWFGTEWKALAAPRRAR